MKLLHLLLLLPIIVSAETTYITIPGQGWTLKVDGPAFTHVDSKSVNDRLRYTASSVETGVTLSIHTEADGGMSNQDCRDTFWARARKNPHLVDGSEKYFETEIAQCVTHRSEGIFRGKPFKTANAHAYFVQSGQCVDLHISHWPYAPSSEQQLETILRSIVVVE